jgi:hypothetical protein
MHQVVELGEAAMAAGSQALLLPMPMFFRYEQQDLEAFCARVTGSLRAADLMSGPPVKTRFRLRLGVWTRILLLTPAAHPPDVRT